MKTWKIGIIGTGMIADFHTQAIQSLPNARLAGFCNVRSEKAKKMAEKYGVKHWKTYQNMLKSDDVDMVLIATPSGAHIEPVIEAEDTAVSILQFENKALGVIYGTTASFPGQFRRLEITGTKGTIVLMENSLQVWQFAEMRDEDEKIIQQYGTIEGGGGVADPAAMTYENHAKNLTAFIQAIEENRPFEIDGEEARKSVALILDIYQSAKTFSIIGKDS